MHKLPCQLSLWHIAREGQVENLESEHHTIFEDANSVIAIYEIDVSA